jgi:beta-carotene 3-hydroxylase
VASNVHWVWFLAYGIAYFLVHEVFIHQRFKWFRNSDNVYFRASVEHTKCTTNTWEKNKGVFGMLIVPWKYLRQELKKQMLKFDFK